MANLEFRTRLLKLAAESVENATELRIMCARDPLFYVNSFVWTYDPRKEPSTLPFVTYPYQDATIIRLIEAILNGEDILIEKSRDMGASWMCMLAYEWLWHFRDTMSFLLASREEALVDKTGNPDCLMWKLDFIWKNQPGWLTPRVHRTHLHAENLETGSVMDGTSTTGDLGVGGRRTGILLDEFSLVTVGHKVLSGTADITRCRTFNSTPRGTGNAYYDQRQNMPESQVIRLHWSKHPEKAKGLYKDPQTNKLRSPWYDKECERRSHPMEIAQELDIDFLGSDYQFFDPPTLDKCVQNYVRPPLVEGELEYDPETGKPLKFAKVKGGKLKLWMHVDSALRQIPRDRSFIVAADVSTGTGASNSTLSVVDCKTGEQVLTAAFPNMKPDKWATLAVAVARWFKGATEEAGGAFLVWEANGPGQIFGDRVIELGYRNIYYRRDEKGLTRKRNKATIPGFWTNRESKLSMLGVLRREMCGGKFINRDYFSVAECREYVYLMKANSVGHSRSASTVDPSGANSNHGDRVIAAALACKFLVERKDVPLVLQKVAACCFKARQDDARERGRPAKDEW